jgi:hypothetical protein
MLIELNLKFIVVCEENHNLKKITEFLSFCSYPRMIFKYKLQSALSVQSLTEINQHPVSGNS